MTPAHSQKISVRNLIKDSGANLQTDNQERWILYSTCDEDSNSEIRALNIAPSDTVLCVTGSGCRTLSLLACNPKHLISVDYSPGQNYLLELKLAAIRNLSYDTLLEFFGVEDSRNRWDIFCSLEDKISPKAAAYFRANRWAIEIGILFSGRHELFYVRFVAPLMRLLYGRAFDHISRASTLEEQRSIYEEHISGSLWRWLIRFGFSPLMLRIILNDPNYFVEMNVNVADYLLERLDHTFTHHLVKDNHWTSLMFYGKYPNKRCLPHFLLEENYLAIRQATTHFEIVTANLMEYIKQLPDQSVDKYSLSDVTSCIDTQTFETLMREVVRTSTASGQLCYRNFLTKQPIPSNLKDVIQRDDVVSSLLDRDDLAFAYTFEVAEIRPREKQLGKTSKVAGIR